MDKKEKEIQTEKEFKKYLNNHKIPFFYIDQTIQKISEKFKEEKIQRPDYLIPIKNKIIAIDVEYKKPLKKYKKFCIEEREVEKYTNLQKKYNIQVYFALSNEEIHYMTWYIIAIDKINRLKKRYLVKKKKYLSLPIQEFKQIATQENITKIFRN
jgi:hypothetical protein